MAITSGTISVRDLHRATMTQEDKPGTPPVYDTPARLSTEAVNVTITPNRISVPAHGDGKTVEVYEGTNGGTIAAQVHAMPIADAVAMFGLPLDGRGGVVYVDNSTPKYQAFGWVTDKANGKSVWEWLYKTKWQVPDYTVDTKTDTVTFQQPTINGTYMSLSDGTFKVNGKSQDVYRYEYDEDMADFDQTVADTWFAAVQMPEPITEPEPEPTP